MVYDGLKRSFCGTHQGMDFYIWIPTCGLMPDQAGRDEEGRFESHHDIGKEEIFQAMEIHNPYTTGELANKLDIPRRTAYKYLEELAQQDRIIKKKPEPRRVIWMRGA